jgi:hypothetical protein
MGLLRTGPRGEVIHPGPTTRGQVKGEIGANYGDTYRKEVEYIFDPKTLKLRARISWVERGTGVVHSVEE